jgi:uncharacterized membrane protein
MAFPDVIPMLLLILGLALFFAVHLVPAAPELRKGLAHRFGEGPYKIVFSLLSLVGFALIVIGYGKLQAMPGKNPLLWYPPAWTKHSAFTLMLPAMILLVAAYVPSRIRTAVGHPMLVAIKLWALAHLIANGDLAALLLFGTFLAWAAFDRVSVRRRGASGPLGAARATSPINDLVVIAIGVGAYAVMLLWGHRWLIGVPLIGT